MSENRLEAFEFDGAPWALEYREENPKHSYWCGPEGFKRQRFLGASTVANVKYSGNVDGLMHWAIEQHKAGKDFKAERELAAEYGNAAHAQLEALAIKGEPLSLTDQPEHVRGVLKGMAEWWLEHRPEFIDSEILVCSPPNRFAGRLDFIARIDGELVLGDLKTKREATWQKFWDRQGSQTFAQMGGYRIGLRDMHQKEVDASYVLVVTSDGDWWWKKDHAPEVSERLFLEKLAVYRGDQDYVRAYTKAAA